MAVVRGGCGARSAATRVGSRSEVSGSGMEIACGAGGPYPVTGRLGWSNMKRSASIVIVESSPLLREALVRLVEDLDAEVVGRYDSVAAGLECVETHQPNLAVLDRDATDQDVFKVIQAARIVSPETGIVLLSAHFNEDDFRRASCAGVRGWALKSDAIDDLRRTTKDVLAGQVVFSPRVRKCLGADAGAAGAGATSRIEQLSEREIQVLACVARGLSAKEIAAVLQVRPRTVERYKADIMGKLNIHDRVLLTRYAICKGLVSPGESDGFA